jgi:hypothetical protein
MVTPSTGNRFRTDLYGVNNVVQNTMLSYPKELTISLLRDEFAKDSYYHYVSDPWGYPKIPDHTDLDRMAGVNDDITTRIFIGEAFKDRVIYYPSVLVRAGSVSSVPISMSRNKFVVDYEKFALQDGYGNTRFVAIPRNFDLAGAWEGSLTIDISTRDILSRDEITSFMMLFFTDLAFERMRKSGVLIKKASAGAPSEADDLQNVKLYKQSITLDIRSEWRRLIPIRNVVDQINVCVDFRSIPDGSPAPNLQINESITITERLLTL